MRSPLWPYLYQNVVPPVTMRRWERGKGCKGLFAYTHIVYICRYPSS